MKSMSQNGNVGQSTSYLRIGLGKCRVLAPRAARHWLSVVSLLTSAYYVLRTEDGYFFSCIPYQRVGCFLAFFDNAPLIGKDELTMVDCNKVLYSVNISLYMFKLLRKEQNASKLIIEYGEAPGHSQY